MANRLMVQRVCLDFARIHKGTGCKAPAVASCANKAAQNVTGCFNKQAWQSQSNLPSELMSDVSESNALGCRLHCWPLKHKFGWQSLGRCSGNAECCKSNGAPCSMLPIVTTKSSQLQGPCRAVGQPCGNLEQKS